MDRHAYASFNLASLDDNSSVDVMAQIYLQASNQSVRRLPAGFVLWIPAFAATFLLLPMLARLKLAWLCLSVLQLPLHLHSEILLILVALPQPVPGPF